MMKWRNQSYLAVFSIVAFLQGCALAPQTIHLAPQVQDHRSSVGQGKVVGLAVADVRPQKKVGIVGDPNAKSVEISAEDESAAGIYNATAEALRHLGFTVRQASEGVDPSLRIELRELEYQSLKLPFTFETKGRVTLAALAQNGSDRYQRTYKANKSSTSGTPPTLSDTERAINELVSMALEDMLTDEQLVAVLAQ
jgi:uncharacterized lipoprotein YajG